MKGHNSTVSSLAVANGVLYSGSWDGTIRLWCLGDHSLLTVLQDDAADARVPVLSLSVDHHFLVSAYENGCVKVCCTLVSYFNSFSAYLTIFCMVMLNFVHLLLIFPLFPDTILIELHTTFLNGRN